MAMILRSFRSRANQSRVEPSSSNIASSAFGSVGSIDSARRAASCACAIAVRHLSDRQLRHDDVEERQQPPGLRTAGTKRHGGLEHADDLQVRLRCGLPSRLDRSACRTVRRRVNVRARNGPPCTSAHEEQGDRAATNQGAPRKRQAWRPERPPRRARRGSAGQAITGARDGLDLEAAVGNSRCELAHGADCAVEAVVADIDAAPTAMKQSLSRHDLPGGIGKHQEHLHDPWFDIRRPTRAGDGPRGRTDDRQAEREIGPSRQTSRGQEAVTRNRNRVVHPCRPRSIGKSSAHHRPTIIAHRRRHFYAAASAQPTPGIRRRGQQRRMAMKRFTMFVLAGALVVPAAASAHDTETPFPTRGACEFASAAMSNDERDWVLASFPDLFRYGGRRVELSDQGLYLRSRPVRWPMVYQRPYRGRPRKRLVPAPPLTEAGAAIPRHRPFLRPLSIIGRSSAHHHPLDTGRSAI